MKAALMSACGLIHFLRSAGAKVSTFVGMNDRKPALSRGGTVDVVPLSFVDVICLFVSLVGSAYLMAGALGPMKHPAVGWFALVPIFVSIYVLRPVFAGLAGVLWGVSVVFLARYAGWQLEALGPWSMLLIAGVPGLYAGFGAALTRWIGFSPFVLAVGWMGVELAVSFGGLRLGLLGEGVESSGWLHSIGMSFGYVVAAFVVAYVNATVVAAIERVPRVGGLVRRSICSPQRCVMAPVLDAEVLFSNFGRIALPRAPPFLLIS